MELPKPPQEIELRNIIDKLAQFVARNGPEFEQMTKNKQKNNPKFSFLFGGEHFNYYQYKVTTEQAILKQKSSRGHSLNQEPVTSMAPPLVINNINQITTSSNSQMDMAVQWLAVAQQQQQANIPLDAIAVQQSQLQDQIHQSELNLAAQHSVLMQQQQNNIDDAVRKSQMDALQRAADEVGISFSEFDSVLQPIIDTCTKDSISAGKGWILGRSTSPKIDEVLALYLLRKVISPSAHFTQKLHIIYLVNDVLHHCARKNADDLKKALENVVVPMFCNASIGTTDEQQMKLNKLLNLWESKNNYFEKQILEKLKRPNESWSEYNANLIAQHASVIAPITNNTKNTYDNYQAQHQAFVQHALQQIQLLRLYLSYIPVSSVLPFQNPHLNNHSDDPDSLLSSSYHVSLPYNQTLEQQKQTIAEQAAAQAAAQQAAAQQAAQQAAAQQAAAAQQVPTVTVVQSGPPNHAGVDPQVQVLQQTSHIPSLFDTVQRPPSPQPTPSQHMQQGISLPPPPHQNEIGVQHGLPPQIPPGLPPHLMGQQNSHPPLHGLPPHLPPGPQEINFSQPPPGYPPINFPPGLELPDLSKPPPGFAPAPITNHVPEILMDDLLPSVPYFELPAGLMVKLVELEDCDYKPLDPDKIRLPPPAPPSERLLAAVEAFYAPACHDRPRDSEGWEKLGLYEFYRAKTVARKKKEDDIAEGLRPRSRSPSPIVRMKSRSKTPVQKKRYRSKSRSRSRSHSRPRSRSPSHSPVQNFESERNKMERNDMPIYLERNEKMDRSERNDRGERSDRGERNDRMERNDRIERNDRSERMDRNERSDRNERYDRNDRNERNEMPYRNDRSDIGPRRSPQRRNFNRPPSRSNSRSRSRSQSRSVSPPGSRSRSRSFSRSHSRSRSRSRSPKRSPTPPSFMGSSYSKTEHERHLDESNKGHQMLRKMGWSGAGLGVQEQGIEQPIAGGEIRDKTDMYKGVGISLNDPYENFRKSKGQAFINRMKARAEERI